MKKPSDTRSIFWKFFGLSLVVLILGTPALGADSSPPAAPVRLIFIHHSTGENWLRDDNGGLGLALRANNYFVSDTNYGWGPDGIGDRTDIGNWYEWFRGPSSPTYLQALYAETEQHSEYSRLPSNPGGENTIIMFKSCFPNSNLAGNPANPPTTGENPLRGQDASSEHMTIENAKEIYLDLLTYFATRRDKLFVVITAPPLAASETSPDYAANARAFNDWLVHEWLKDYPFRNVAVFDFYNVLTSNGGNPNINDVGSEQGNHHRWWNGAVQHIHTVASNTSAYPSASDDSHPTQAGNHKATAEFVPLLNDFYHRWRESLSCTPPPVATIGINGSESDRLLDSSETITVTISLNPGCSLNQPADWWVAASTPFGWYFLDASSGTPYTWRSGLEVTYRGPLFSVDSFPVLEISDLPPGRYTFYFGVDLSEDGKLSVETLYYDTVTAEITETE